MRATTDALVKPACSHVYLSCGLLWGYNADTAVTPDLAASLNSIVIGGPDVNAFAATLAKGRDQPLCITNSRWDNWKSS